jgi:hypothetical protein
MTVLARQQFVCSLAGTSLIHAFVATAHDSSSYSGYHPMSLAAITMPHGYHDHCGSAADGGELIFGTSFANAFL